MKARDMIFWSAMVIGGVVGAYKVYAISEQGALLVADPVKASAIESSLPSVVAESPQQEIVLPDFSQYVDVKTKKTAFFDFMLPMIELENQRLLELRKRLIALQSDSMLSSEKLEWLSVMADRYRVDTAEREQQAVIAELLVRVDVVPGSLALSQSANESAWGTSRFAVKGNNLFGQWCFSKGCGIVPANRDSGSNHEVAKFSSPPLSVNSYIHNLNTHRAYAHLRSLRADLRMQQQTLSGKLLAEGLLKYSSRGDEYVKELQAMIRVNKLAQYDLI